jgi:hypothetical protein
MTTAYVKAKPIHQRCWEWEDGGGFSVLTHDPEVGAQWIRESIEENGTQDEWKEIGSWLDADPEFLGPEYIRQHGRKKWVTRHVLDVDDSQWDLYDLWLPGRVPITLIEV